MLRLLPVYPYPALSLVFFFLVINSPGRGRRWGGSGVVPNNFKTDIKKWKRKPWNSAAGTWSRSTPAQTLQPPPDQVTQEPGS